MLEGSHQQPCIDMPLASTDNTVVSAKDLYIPRPQQLERSAPNLQLRIA
jgi:hypothetical protein